MLALATLSLAAAASAQGIRTTVDSIQVSFPDVQPVMMNGRVMVPVRGVFEHMNANVDWNSNSHTVTAQHGSDTIVLPLHSNYATVNGQQVRLDSPATVYNGRTMVPLRFLSESLGATVEWLALSRTVEIKTTGTSVSPLLLAGYTPMHLGNGTVIPFTLNQRLSSDGSSVGDRFTANLDTDGTADYQGLPLGTVLEGHVSTARAKTGDTPGVLGLAFDRVRMTDGKAYKVNGTLIGLDSNSVTNVNGKLTAKPGAKNDNLKYVGYGAGGGAILALLTKGNIITNSLIGGALGYLFGEIKKDPSKSNNVVSEPGTKFGVRLTRDLSYQIAANSR